MKINSVCGYGLTPGKNRTFGAGKVELFSDFDNTYCPISHKNLKKITPDEKDWFSQYCESFKKFFNNTRKGLKFHITTGRTFGEYEKVSKLINDKGFELPLPDTFIAKNGSDEYLKVGTDKDFFKKGIFPFQYDKTNLEKEKKIKELTGWDGPKVKAKLKELFKEHKFRIVEGDTEHGAGDYGIKSLFSEGKLHWENGKPFTAKDKAEWVVGLRNDGNCKVFVTYPPDMLSNDERNKVFNSINDKLKQYMDESGFLDSHSYLEPKNRSERVNQVIEPVMGLGKHLQKSETGLTKLYDTKEAVKNAVKNNDLVIVAGEGKNDLTMLNPLMYLNVDSPLVSSRSPEFVESLLHEESLVKQVNELPLMSVVIKNEENEIPQLTKVFGKDGKCFKVIEVEKGHLEDGIKEAIKVYSEKNPEYAEKLSPDLKKEIFKSSSEKLKSAGLSKAKKIKCFAIGAAVILGIAATILCIKKFAGRKKSVTPPATVLPPLASAPKCFSEISSIIN